MNKIKALFLLIFLVASNVWSEPQLLDQIVAIVDDDIILQSSLDVKISQIKAGTARNQTGLPPDDILRRQVLDSLIIENLQLQKGQRYGIRISDAELNDALTNIAANNNLTLAQLFKAAQNDGFSEQTLRQNVTNEIIINKVRQYEVSEQIHISKQEIKNFLAENAKIFNINEEYNLANILLALPFNADDSLVQKAYNQALNIYNQAKNGQDFSRLAVTYSSGDNALKGGVIGWRKLLDLPSPFNQLIADLKAGDVTQPVRTQNGFMLLKVLDKRQIDLRLQEFNVRHILLKTSELRSDAQTKALISKLAGQIKNGADFADLAGEYSEDYGSAANGGALDWVNPNSLVPEFRDAMQNLALNKLSDPVKTQYGWHILEVLDKRDVDISSQMQENQVQQILHNRKYETELQSWLSKLKDEAYIEIKI